MFTILARMYSMNRVLMADFFLPAVVNPTWRVELVTAVLPATTASLTVTHAAAT